MKLRRTPPHLLTLIVLAGFSPLSLNMFLPSLANIADDLGTDYAMIAWSVSGYLAITAVLQLIIGPLSDRIGRRPVMLVALAFFGIASAGCALAQDFVTFLIFRMFQGGMTAGYTLSMAIVRDTRSEREAVSLIGYIGMSMAIAPMVGPMLGGMLDTIFGWRSVFVFYALSGVVLFTACWFDLGETRVKAVHDTEHAAPQTTALLSEPLFWAFALCGAFSVGAFYVFLTGAPLVAVAQFGVSTAELGVYIGTITVGFMFGGFIAGRYGARFDPATTMIAGRVVACLGLSVGAVALSLTEPTPLLFFGSTIFVGLGNGITMPASNTGAMSVRPDLAGSAAGVLGSLIVGGGALLTALTGAIVTETDGARTVLFIMLAVSAIGLALGCWARHLRMRVSPASP